MTLLEWVLMGLIALMVLLVLAIVACAMLDG